jgi:transposase-like protein
MYNNKILRRYSKSLKIKILTELSHGNYTKTKLGKINGINPTTINQWIKKYDRKDLINTTVMIESKDEISRLKALQKEVEQLKYLLIKKDLDKLVMDNHLEVAAENLGYKNAEELKKLKYKALMKSVALVKE